MAALGPRAPWACADAHMWTVASLVMALAAAGLAGVAQAAGVCPDGVDVAPTHWTLLVGPAGLRLANGTLLPQLAYNGTIVGPTLRATLGDDVSVDVVNELDIGARLPCWAAPVPLRRCPP